MLITGIIHYRLFQDNYPVWRLFWRACIVRFFLSSLLSGIMVKIILLLRESKRKDDDNQRLRNAFLEAELELLKQQINPHFLFNSLSNLSGIVRENAVLAQHYIGHLSKVFRYALQTSGSTLVTLQEELDMLKSFEQLLKIRFENAFELNVSVAEEMMTCRIPHLSLQPLLENAAKHNSATLAKPLKVYIYSEVNFLVVTNNVQPLRHPEQSTGLGLYNLAERYRILMHAEIEIAKTDDRFIVKLPLK
jgi:two-component system LytT family sensor kinase